MWKTGWIFQVFGRWSWYTIGDRTLVTVNGPSRLGANFGLIMRRFRFRASSQTLSPLAKGLKPLRERELMTCRASS